MQSPVLHEDNPSNQVAHEFYLIHTSLDFRSQEYYDLSNQFFEVKKYDRTSDADGFHPNNNDHVILTDNNFPHAIFFYPILKMLLSIFSKL